MKKMHVSWANRLFYLFNSVLWIVVMVVILYPLYLVLISSISSPAAVRSGKVVLWPVDLFWGGYESIFEYKELWVAYANSIFYTISHVFIALIVTMMAGYTMSRARFFGKKAINIYFVITMFFGGGLIPTFLTMRDIGLYNNRLILIIGGCVSTWNLMLARTYMQSNIPEELYEASILDGASHFQYFLKVVMPLSKTIIAVLSVYYGIGKWNDYFTGLVYIRDRNKLPLQTILREILATLQVDMSGDFMLAMADNMEAFEEALNIAYVSKYCIIVVSTVPVVILYLFVQKYFEKGVMIGSLKG